MAAEKKVLASVKVQCEAGKANPAPPIGPALGPYGINIMQFCKEFNDKTGLNVQVKLSKRWQDIRASLDAMLKEQENQAEIKPEEKTPDEPSNDNIEQGGEENET